MSYYDDIDPIGEERDYCKNCGISCSGSYCSDECKIEHNE